MTLPKKVFIGAHIYQVISDAEALLHIEAADARCLNGYCHLEQCQIILNPISPLCNQRIHLLHEVLHGLIYDRRLEGWFKNEEEEDFLKSFTSGLVDILRSNPQLVAFLMEEEA